MKIPGIFGTSGGEAATDKRRRFLKIFLVLSLGAIYPFLSLLWHHSYPVFTPETLLIFVLVVSAALFLTAILIQAGPFVASLPLIVFVMIVAMVQFNLQFIGMMAVVGAGLVLLMILRKGFLDLLLAVLPMMIVGAWFDNSPDFTKFGGAGTETVVADSEGPVIHLLMDAFSGIEGLQAWVNGVELRNEMLELFENHGFEVYPRAYSHYSSTIDSMTRAFNFRKDDENIFQNRQLPNEPLAITENRWFGVMAELGYRWTIYQTEAFDFCGVHENTGHACYEFPNPVLGSIRGNMSSPVQRAKELTRILLIQSKTISGILKRNDVPNLVDISVFDERVLEQLAQDIIRNGDSRHAYFAHVLLPHAPLVYNSDCSLDYSSESWLRWPASSGPIGNSPESQALRRAKLVSQMKCAVIQLSRFLDKLDRSAMLERSTIVIHSDHGGNTYIFSPAAGNRDLLSYDDLRESFSILFAVKYPNRPFRLNQEISSLDDLLLGVAEKITGKPEADFRDVDYNSQAPFVYLNNTEPLERFDINIFKDQIEDARVGSGRIESSLDSTKR